MKMYITIEMDNAAFEPPETEAEIFRILKQLSERILEGDIPDNIPGTLFDINGNAVGSVRVLRQRPIRRNR
jgi:hypothetical protein